MGSGWGHWNRRVQARGCGTGILLLALLPCNNLICSLPSAIKCLFICIRPLSVVPCAKVFQLSIATWIRSYQCHVCSPVVPGFLDLNIPVPCLQSSDVFVWGCPESAGVWIYFYQPISWSPDCVLECTGKQFLSSG